MMRAAMAFLGLIMAVAVAHATDTCQQYVKAGDLPSDFKEVGAAAMGPAKLTIKSDGKCTCNDLPTVQRHLGQEAPQGVNWACDVADPDDTKGK